MKSMIDYEEWNIRRKSMCKTILEIKYIYGKNPPHLQLSVQDKINQGWQPYGFLVMDSEGYMYQSMVKYEEEQELN